ncbi:MAG: enoyl-CoA hydratase/isomerase family protein [Betaproteobacteria bacterium]|nr:MAG: enoyl-CoA hydratase/isomerase family protein [Betaproteobacteria bacterium]
MSGLRTERNGEVLRITLDRPEKRNALGEAEWEEMQRLVDELRTSVELEIVVLQATGDVFCAGVDLDLIAEARKKPDGLVELVERNGAIIEALGQLPQIVVVALNGPAIGIAVHLAMAADFVLATRDAYLQLPEARLGMPDVMHVHALEQRLGRGGVLAFTLLCERLTVTQATAAGFIHREYVDMAELARGLEALIVDLTSVKPAVRREVKRACINRSAMGGTDMQVRAVRSVR